MTDEELFNKLVAILEDKSLHANVIIFVFCIYFSIILVEMQL